jgi:nucleotide-binding universal stress UspA family protein
MLQTTQEDVSPVLVTVDFSAASEEAVKLAVQLAGCSSRSLVVLHVAHDSTQNPDRYRRRSEQEQILPIEEIAGIRLQEFMSRMRKAHLENETLLNAKVMVVSGLPETRIPEIARQAGAGLIVMGGHGRSSLSKLIGGSVSEKVIRHSAVPVTMIHLNAKASKAGIVKAGGAEECQAG